MYQVLKQKTSKWHLCLLLFATFWEEPSHVVTWLQGSLGKAFFADCLWTQLNIFIMENEDRMNQVSVRVGMIYSRESWDPADQSEEPDVDNFCAYLELSRSLYLLRGSGAFSRGLRGPTNVFPMFLFYVCFFLS